MEKNVFKCFLIMNFYNTIDKNLYTVIVCVFPLFVFRKQEKKKI